MKQNGHFIVKKEIFNIQQVSIIYISLFSPSTIKVFWFCEVYVAMNYVLMDILKIIFHKTVPTAEASYQNDTFSNVSYTHGCFGKQTFLLH